MKTTRKFPEHLRDEEHIFYLMTEGIEDSIESNVWFVNNSEETLKEVYNTSVGFAGVDDDFIPMTAKEDNERYKNVKPKEAVLIDLYDPIFDGDFVIQFCVTITADSFGTKKFCAESCKGGNPNGTLHWKPLPPESVDPENPDEPLSPEKAALDYVARTGRYLGKFVSLNSGDLKMDYTADRLASTGLSLEKQCYRDGHVTAFTFKDESGSVVFQTCVLSKAGAFVKNLKSKTGKFVPVKEEDRNDRESN